MIDKSRRSNFNKSIAFFILAIFIFLSIPTDDVCAAGQVALATNLRAKARLVEKKLADKLVFERKKDEIFFAGAPDNLKEVLANAPLEKLKIARYMKCRRSRSLHAAGRAVDISTRNLSRSQLQLLIEYLYGLSQAEALLTGQLPQYNLLDGKRYSGKKYNARHKTHVHYGVKQ